MLPCHPEPRTAFGVEGTPRNGPRLRNGIHSLASPRKRSGLRCSLDFARNDGIIGYHGRLSSGYSARTVSAIPPRAENCAVTITSRGAHALIKLSKIRFVTASLKARSLRYDAR